MRRTIGTVVGAALVATVVAGCLVRPYYGDRRYDTSYNTPYHSGYDYHYNDRYHEDDWDQHHHRDDGDRPTIVCASQDGQAHRCRTDFPIRHAEVDKRYSNSRCDYGRSWGYDSNAIWVDRGCRARFVVTPAGGWR